MKLESFIDKHKGETAWVFGKGPSLDGFDFSIAGKLRVAINDLVGVVPNVTYAFANDRVIPWIDLYDPRHVLFTPYRTAKDYEERPDCRVVVFDDHPGEALLRDKKKMCECLQIREGTLGSVFQVLYIMGVSRIVCVGIDGGQTHGRRFAWRTNLTNEHYKIYNNIKHRFIEGCEELGIEVRFFNEQGADMDGKKTVLLTGNTAVRGVHYDEGSIVTLFAKDALDLVQCGQAVFTQAKVAKEEPKVETAAVEPVVEVPEKRTVTRRVKKGTKKVK